MKLKSWILEVEIMNSWSWNREFTKLKLWSWDREFMKLKSWIREVGIVTPRVEIMKLKSWIREFEIVNSWILYVEIVNTWSWNREFKKMKGIHEVEMSPPVFRRKCFYCLHSVCWIVWYLKEYRSKWYMVPYYINIRQKKTDAFTCKFIESDEN